MGMMRIQLTDIPDAEISLSASGEGGPSEADLVIQVFSSDSEELSSAESKVFDILRTTPGLVEVQTSREKGKPEIDILPLRAQLAGREMTVGGIARIARTAYEGANAGVYRERGEEFDIIVRMGKEERGLLAYLKDFPLPTPGGAAIPLSELGLFEKKTGDASILHRDKRRMIEITANIASGTLGEARKAIDMKLSAIDFPEGVAIQYGGDAELQDESFAAIFEALILAIVLVYIVMAAILESFVQPFTVMITLPLGLIGVAMALFFSGQTINIMSLMAVVMLVGIVVNNAILILDYTASLRRKGYPAREALLEGCTTRLRPIIIANLAIAVGMIPQVIGGAGAEYRTPMAVVLIGGVLIAALFTLFVIPAVYTLIDKFSFAGRPKTDFEI
jgi:HAE1 family hydrophobic/amphiphilic exporter-1